MFSTVSISDSLIIKSSELKSSDIPNTHHIYMVLGFERLFVSDIVKDNDINNRLQIFVETEFSEPFTLIWDGDDEIFTFSKSFDKRSVEINGENYSILDIVLFYAMNEPGLSIVSEILYIGQAKGVKVSRNTGERLNSHSTLQRILADCLDSEKHFDIRVVSFSITEDLMWTNLTTIDTSNASADDIYNITKKGFSLKIPDSSMINLVEAKLINFFKPEYNDKNKKVPVPSKHHKSYIEYNKLFNGMNINLRQLHYLYFKQPNILEFNPSNEIISYELNDTEFMELMEKIND